VGIRRSLLLAVAFVVVPIIILHPSSSAADTVVAEQLVARVNGRPILLSEIRTRARPHLRRLDPMKSATETQKLYGTILEQRIDEEIVASLAAPLHVTISESDVDAAVTSIAKQNHMEREDMLRAALTQGMTVGELRAELRRALLRQRVIFTLGIRDKTTASTYPRTNADEQTAWLARIESTAFTAEKRRACIERWVRW